ncbi:hypothetical protein MNBD_ALPHA01-869 [hydrothermal vent metagenome]|uniref:MoaB/Mog domain-containing protein n=1 Tax=hydrothermal vent metagenome TaxID=652676 RepID=A0A3B0RE54_9ZZZZ
MKFGEFSLSEVLGAYLAHGVRLSDGLLKKGHLITGADIRRLAENNITHVMVAILEPGDMTEDDAAARISRHIAGEHITCGEAFTGRANLYAAAGGVITISTRAVNGLNHRDEAITLATLPEDSVVHKGQMVATVKIIPLAVEQKLVQDIIHNCDGGLITLKPFRPQKVLMIQTILNGDKLFEKTRRVMAHRLGGFGATLGQEHECRHEEIALSSLLQDHMDGDHDMIMIMGASAITDRKDVIPAAIRRAGGEVIHFGMPVDPGNLMLLAKLRGKWLLGLPGCSRSPKLNGIDLVLSRICAGLDITPDQIMNMGVGGLLSEYAGRPQPRDIKRQDKKMSTPGKIAAIVLAAGQSKRMGQENKLLLPFEGQTVLSHVLEQVEQAGFSDTLVITGHQKDRIEQEISRHDAKAVHNDLYEEGISSSVKLGIGALAKDIDAALVILGDMPNISAGILEKIIAAYDPDKGRSIIIPKHNGKRGNPILWHHEFFSDFDRLEGDMGAKILLKDYPEYISEVEIESNAIFLDMDTFEAYERLKDKK